MIQEDKNKNEREREDRFKKIAARRTERVLVSLRVLGNCSNKSAYKYSDEDISKIFRAIEEQLRIAKARFQSHRNHKKFNL